MSLPIDEEQAAVTIGSFSFTGRMGNSVTALLWPCDTTGDNAERRQSIDLLKDASK